MYVSPDIHTYIHTGYALKVCTFGPCIHTYIHTYIHTSSCLGMYVSPNIHTYHTYLSFSRYVCSPETYIPLILRYVPLDHTYIPRWGGRQGMPARYLLTSEYKVCMLPPWGSYSKVLLYMYIYKSQYIHYYALQYRMLVIEKPYFP